MQRQADSDLDLAERTIWFIQGAENCMHFACCCLVIYATRQAALSGKLYVCMYVCIYVCIYIRTYLCMHGCAYVMYMHVRMYSRTYHIYVYLSVSHVCMFVYVYLCMYMY
jgi:hypothetical protein